MAPGTTQRLPAGDRNNLARGDLMDCLAATFLEQEVVRHAEIERIVAECA